MSKVIEYLAEGKRVESSGRVSHLIKSRQFEVCTREQVEAATSSEVVRMEGLWVHYHVYRGWMSVGITPMNLTRLDRARAIGKGNGLIKRLRAFFTGTVTIEHLREKLFDEVFRQARIKERDPANFVERRGLLGYDVRVLTGYTPEPEHEAAKVETSQSITVGSTGSKVKGSGSNSVASGLMGAAAGALVGSGLAADEAEDCVINAVEDFVDDCLGLDSGCSDDYDFDGD